MPSIKIIWLLFHSIPPVADISPPRVAVEDLPEEEVRSKLASEKTKGEGNLVEVYADRLCAVSHAFALTCTTLQRSSKRYECD